MNVVISPNTILYVYKLNSIERARYISGEQINVTLLHKVAACINLSNIGHVIH